MPLTLRSFAAHLAWLTFAFAPDAPMAADSTAFSATTVAGRRALVLTPESAARDAALPLLVLLHWSESTPEEIARLVDWPALPVRILIPQGAHPRPHGWSWFAEGYAEMGAEAARAETLRAVDEIAAWLEAARRELPTAGAPMVAGVSYGGDLAFLLAVLRPTSVGAAFPVAARFLPEWLPAARGCGEACPAVFALHGDADTVVPIAPTREAVDELARRGWPVELRGYPGVGHGFTRAMRDDLGRAVARRLNGDGARP